MTFPHVEYIISSELQIFLALSQTGKLAPYSKLGKKPQTKQKKLIDYYWDLRVRRRKHGNSYCVIRIYQYHILSNLEWFLFLSLGSKLIYYINFSIK